MDVFVNVVEKRVIFFILIRKIAVIVESLRGIGFTSASLFL
jgi:hypothetical protein